MGKTAGAVLMGLSLTACPAGDDTDDTGASSMTNGGTSSTTEPGSTSDPGSTSAPGSTSTDPGSTSFSPDYGVAETGQSTGAATSSSSGGDTDSSSTGDVSTTTIGGPEYGVPETTGK